MNDNGSNDIAIIGMACVLPGAPDAARYWENILHKVNAISDAPPEWEAELFYEQDTKADDRTYCKRGGFLGKLAQFDPFSFGIMPNAVDGGEPDHYMALQASQDALKDCGPLDLVVIDGNARGIVTRDLITGKIESHVADAVVLGTGGYGNAYYLSTNAKGCNATAIWRAYKKGALFANPCFTQIHPTCIPVTGEYQSKLTLMSESLRNDGRIWVPLNKGDKRPPNQIPAAERDYFLERRYPSFGNLVPRDVASRNAKAVCDEGRGVGESGLGVYLDFSEAIQRLGQHVIKERYGNLFDMYERITGENPYEVPMRIYPAIHYTMGGLWVDYNLMSTIPGLYVTGEANFSDDRSSELQSLRH